MHVKASTYLPVRPEAVWELLQTPALLNHVAAPLLYFRSMEQGGFPEHWSDGAHRVNMFALGFIPLGPQILGIEIGPNTSGVFRMRDNGSGLLVRKWDHLITLEADGVGTRYTDKVRVEAGLLTPFVWIFAIVFYRWRQSRWRSLVKQKLRASHIKT